MATITNTMTYIQNPAFPTPVSAGTAARTFTYPITALATTAAIRLDFQTGVFEQPTATTGACGAGDNFAVTEAASGRTGLLCGTLTGQHIYLDNNGMAGMTNSITITVSTTSTNLMRSWKILVTILEVGDSSIEGRAPGCLQWFTGATGQITSFNHLNGATQGQMLNSLNYPICIKPEGGLGCVDFRESGGTVDSFRLDSAASATASAQTCASAALIIPNNAVATPTYCGSFLSATTAQTGASPVRSTGHTINVFTAASAANPAAGASFDVIYTQVAC